MKKYRPSNGTEGMAFTDHFCDRCIHQHPDPDHDSQCNILMRSMCFDIDHEQYPEEWTYDDHDSPTCTNWKKWDWGRDDDGNWIEPTFTPPDDPNQLCFPFIFDEIGINNIQKQTTNA